MTTTNNPINKDLADVIVAMECAALDRWGNGDPSGFLEICAPDVVYFDPHLEMRIDGREALRAYYEPIKGTVFFERFELLNPLVQIVGDAAILTFNYVSYGKAGDESRWNCTEVYQRLNEGWRIIQTHWSFTLAVRA
jgi:ketosteroid isomerase-like protein